MFVRITNCEDVDGWYAAHKGDTTGMVFEVNPERHGQYSLIKSAHNDSVLSKLRGITIKDLRGDGRNFSSCYIEKIHCEPYGSNNKDMTALLDKEW